MRTLDDLPLERCIRLLELYRHTIELLTQRFKLVICLDRYAMTEVSASDPHGARAQLPDWINHSAYQLQTGHDCHQNAGREQYYRDKNGTVKRCVGLAFGQFYEDQPTGWRNRRISGEHRMPENIFSIGGLERRRTEVAASQPDLSE